MITLAMSNEDILNRADVEDIEITLTKCRLRWFGHVTRAADSRPTKMLLYGELAEGSRPVGRPKLRFKDTCKSLLKNGNVLDGWRNVVDNRPLWRNTIKSVCEQLNTKRIKTYERKKEKRRVNAV